MRIGGTRILTCPHCGGTEEVSTLLSGNTVGATYWSDGKMVAPMLPYPHAVQKCPHCSKYYLWYKQKEVYRHDDEEEVEESYELEGAGVSYDDFKEALQQLLAEGLEEDDEKGVRKDFIYSFNDHFYREGWLPIRNKPTPTGQDLLIFKENVLKYIEFLDAKKYTTLIAELYREIGDFAKCEKILSEAEEASSKEMLRRSMILERCKDSDVKVFCLNPDDDTYLKRRRLKQNQ